MPIKSEHIIDLRGKKFVLLAGLLELAHEMGLKGIETTILPLSQPAEQVWIVQAIARFARDGEDALFWGHGEATPGNSQMRGALLRHAETRAIARALRFGTGIGMTAAEELGPDAEPDGNGHAARPAPAPRSAPAGAAVSTADAPVCQWPDCGKEMTKNQVTMSQHKLHMNLCPAHLKEMQEQSAPEATR